MHRTTVRTKSFLRELSWLAAGVSIALTGCNVGAVDTGSNADAPTWEEFKAQTYLEPWEDGVYVVNGDEPVSDEKKLREFYDSLYGGSALIVHQAGNADAKWDAQQRLDLSYCVSDQFGQFKDQMVTAMDQATGAWEAAADVDFVHETAEDANCTQNNNNVLFDVRPVQGAPYLARAFFPGENRNARNVLVDQSSFGNLGAITLTGILRHELGHVLGFRHEHTRPESGTCFEDNNWRPLTEYDQLSVMHYPQCNGVAGRDLTLTAQDLAGAEALYGAPGSGTQDPDTPTQGTPQSGQVADTIAQGEQHNYQALSVVPGSLFVAQLSGTGDADLYVRFDQAPTRFAFDCRPYLVGSNERCSLDVPAGASTAHIMVDGYTSANYQIEVNWVAP